MTVPLLSGFAPIAGNYDAAILDLWGVLHDGRGAHPAALKCLEEMRGRGLRLVVLSNAPRRSHIVIEQTAALGLAREAYDEIVTSGDIARAALGDGAPWGRRYFHVGPPRDVDLLTGLDYETAAQAEAADFILNTGLFDDETETADDYADFLGAARARDQPMVCVNPDLTVMRGSREVQCGGALAAAYEALGGRVEAFGKPHPSAYAACFAVLNGVARDRIVAIGDSLRTDIAGAQAAGIDAVFVAGGIHAAELGCVPGQALEAARLQRFIDASGQTPVAALAALTW